MVLPKALLQSCLAKALLKKSCFGGGDVGEVTEDGGEARHVEGDANVGADVVCRMQEKLRENALELISYIFRDLGWVL